MSAYDTFKAGILGDPFDVNKKPSRQAVVQGFLELQTEVDGKPTSVEVQTIDDRTTAIESILISGLKRKEAVHVATTANITLSGEQTIDGLTTSSDRVLVKDQLTPSENGIYVSAAGAWSRSTDMNDAVEFQNSLVFVNNGTMNAGSSYYTGEEITTVGTDDVNWQLDQNQSQLQTDLTEVKNISFGNRKNTSVLETLFETDNQERIIGKDTAPISASNGGAGTYLFTGRPAIKGVISEISVWASAQTAILKIYRPSAIGATDYTLAYEVSLVLQAGLNTFEVGAGTLGDYETFDGDILGFYFPSGIHFQSVAGSDAYTFFSGNKTDGATFDNLGDVGGVELQASITIVSKSDYGLIKAVATENTMSRLFSVGETTLAAPSPLQYLPKDYTIAWSWDFKAAAILQSLALSTEKAGVGKIIVLEKNNGGYKTAKSIQVKYGAGVVTLTAGVDFPKNIIVPKGGLIAFKCGTYNSIHNTVFDNLQRMRNFYGDASDGIFPSYKWPSGLENLSQVVRPPSNAQIRFDFLETVDPIHLNEFRYIAFDDFSETYGSVVLQGDAWVKGAGKMSSGTVGIANGLEWIGGFTHLTDFKCRWKFQFTSSGEVYFYKRPETGSQGSIVGFDMASGNVKLYNMITAAGALGALNNTRTCDVTLTTGRDYIVTLDKNYRDWTLTLTDALTGVSDVTTWDGDASAAAGFAYGTPGIAVASGAVDLYDFRTWANRKKPQVLLFGDSITEGTGGTTIADTWAYKVCENANGIASPRGGDTATSIVQRALDEINCFQSIRYAIFLMGINDTNMASWQLAVDNVAELCQTYNVVPVFGTLPPEASDTNPVLVQNPYLRANYRVIDFARALTTGGDGTTRDEAKFSDAVHPNDAGHLAMFERVRLDLSEIFD